MNALARIKDGAILPPERSPADAAFAAVEQVCAALSESADPQAALPRVLALLEHDHGLKSGRVALARGDGRIETVVGHGEADKPEATQPTMRKCLATMAPVALRVAAVTSAGRKKRGEKVWLLAAPIVSDSRPIGLLTALPAEISGDCQATNLFLLGLIANLLAAVLGPLCPDKDPVAGKKPAKKEIVGESEAIRTVLDQAQRVARGALPILLRGESGAGKELFAQFIHDRSPRAKKPFVKINCASLSEGVLESELFGHERGAFTGAETQRKGRFELADGGTLLLDEIGDISPAFQAKLLRVLQEGEFERVGGDRTIKVDVRIVAATHCDLEAAVRRRAFRADLYYRLAVTPLRVPSLRERREDIPLIARHIVKRFNSENDRALSLHPGAEALLCKCAFPGNVRELENCVRAAATMAREAVIVERDFGCRNRSCFSARLRHAYATARGARRPSP